MFIEMVPAGSAQPTPGRHGRGRTGRIAVNWKVDVQRVLRIHSVVVDDGSENADSGCGTTLRRRASRSFSSTEPWRKPWSGNVFRCRTTSMTASSSTQVTGEGRTVAVAVVLRLAVLGQFDDTTLLIGRLVRAAPQRDRLHRAATGAAEVDRERHRLTVAVGLRWTACSSVTP